MKRVLALMALLAGIPAAAAEAPALLPSEAFRDYRPADFCQDIADSFGRQDLALVERHFDYDGLVRKSIPDGLDPVVAAGLGKGLRGRLVETLADPVRSEKLTWHARLQDEGGADQRCTLGAIADDGLLVFDLYVERRGKGLLITDTRNHGMARRTSELMYRLFSNILPLQELSGATDGSSASRLVALGRDDRLKRVSAFVKSLDGTNHAAMIEAYELMPEDARREPVLLIRLINGVRANDRLYQRYLGKLATLVGDDPDFSFMLFDLYLDRKDKPRILRARQDASDRAAHLMPLLVLGVVAEREAGGEQGIRRSLSRLLQANDGYEPLYWFIAEDATGRGDFETGVTALKVLQHRFGHDFSEAAPDEHAYLQKLRGSAAFRAWMDRQAGATAP